MTTNATKAKDWFRRMLDAFFMKNGRVSKTAIFLSLYSFCLLVMWVFQSLFVGTQFWDWWTVPEFSVGAATAVMTIFSGLYIFNHSKHVGTDQPEQDMEDLATLRSRVEQLTNAVQGQGSQENS